MDGPATLATSLIGLRISPHFDEPYLSHSMAAFWGRRWNITASNTLRFLFYDTICEGGSGKMPDPHDTCRERIQSTETLWERRGGAARIAHAVLPTRRQHFECCEGTAVACSSDIARVCTVCCSFDWTWAHASLAACAPIAGAATLHPCPSLRALLFS
jgi:hypothetical protein